MKSDSCKNKLDFFSFSFLEGVWFQTFGNLFLLAPSLIFVDVVRMEENWRRAFFL